MQVAAWAPWGRGRILFWWPGPCCWPRRILAAISSFLRLDFLICKVQAVNTYHTGSLGGSVTHKEITCCGLDMHGYLARCGVKGTTPQGLLQL